MTLYEQLEGNGLIAFSDPAGAKAGLSVAKILARIFPDAKVTLVSNKSYPFYTDWNLPVEIVASLPASLPEDTQWVFTGTSHPESSDRFELGYLNLANQKNLPSFSFIDHWTLLALRFEDRVGNFILPNKIIVVDEHAKNLAVEDNLPSERIVVFKNPYLDYIENFWRPKLTNSEVRKLLKLEPKIPIILYAPDPLTLRGEDKDYGFDEAQVLHELLQVVLPYKCHVLVKAHPLQPINILERVMTDNPKAKVTMIKNELGNLDLMANSNVIIGFYSNFLIEAAALGKNIIRYFPKSTMEDPIRHLSIGEIVDSPESLKAALIPKLK